MRILVLPTLTDEGSTDDRPDAAQQVVIAHYQAVRTEILDRQRRRDQYLVLYGSVVAIVSGVVVNDLARWPLVLAIPFLSMVLSVMYANNDMAISSLGRWLKRTYSPMIARYEDKVGPRIHLRHWDDSEELSEFARKWRSKRYVSAMLTFVLPGVLTALPFFLVGPDSRLMTPLTTRFPLLPYFCGTLALAFSGVGCWFLAAAFLARRANSRRVPVQGG